MSNNKGTQEHRGDQTIISLGLVMCAGVLGILFYAAQFGNIAQFASIAGVGIAMAVASALSGGLFGFLFGIPRVSPKEPSKEPQPSEAKSRDAGFQPNTNLTEISDWLTKILVGVGLTQLRDIAPGMEHLAAQLAPALGNVPSSGPFAVTILLGFVVCGFLEGYLWTRLILQGEFRLADLEALGQQVKQVRTEAQEAVRRIEEQRELDARALALTLSQLNPAPGVPPVAQADLNAAVRRASPVMRAQIFYQAQAERRASWRSDKPKMELTIPIFRALITNDPERKYHRNHAQLGYALKDQRTPNWTEALAELNEAIAIRGPWQDHGWIFYELNRAMCRIALDESYQKGKPSAATVRERIIEDLKVAATQLAHIIDKEARITGWMTLNLVRTDELVG